MKQKLYNVVMKLIAFLLFICDAVLSGALFAFPVWLLMKIALGVEGYPFDFRDGWIIAFCICTAVRLFKGIDFFNTTNIKKNGEK